MSAKSWTSKIMVSIHEAHKEPLMALKQGSDLMCINTSLEPPLMQATRRRPGVEHCQNTVLHNACGPPPLPAL